MGETEEERRARKERERAERKAREAASAGGTEHTKRDETDEERRARKERERAERKAREAVSAGGTEHTKRDETEEERRARKERERAERKAREAASAGGTGHTKRDETDEERRARKERERAERKARESGGADSSTPALPSGIQHRSTSGINNNDMLPALRLENEAALHEDDKMRDHDAMERQRQHVTEGERELSERRERRRSAKERQRQGASPSEDNPVAVAIAFDAAELQRQGYRAQFERDLARATALRRLLNLDDMAAVIVDITPQSEYDMYVRNLAKNGRRQVGVQAPAEEDRIDVSVQVAQVKQRSRVAQIPDDLGLFPEQDAERLRFQHPRADGELGDGRELESDPPVKGQQLNVDAGLLSQFMSRVLPVVSAALDENTAATGTDTGKAKSGTSFSSSYNTFLFPGTRDRPVLKVCFSPSNSQYFAALYGSSGGGSGDASSVLDQYASVILLWNVFDSTVPEHVLVSFSTVACLCFSPCKTYMVYAGMEDGSVALWDLREPDRNHFSTGRCERAVCRLPSYSTAWQVDNHTAAIQQVAVVGYNSVVGLRRDEHEQVASVDLLGLTKFWAASEKDQSKATIHGNDYGSHPFSTVRLSLVTTSGAERPDTSTMGPSDERTHMIEGRSKQGMPNYAFDLDFTPSDATHYVIAMSNGLRHVSRFGSVAAPSTYHPSSRYLDVPVAVPCCVRYSTQDSRVLVAGYEDGCVRLYLQSESKPQLTVPLGGYPIEDVRCSCSSRWVTWALDRSGTLHMLDHARLDRETAVMSQQLTQPESGMCISFDIPVEEKAESHLLVLGYTRGIVEVHTLDGDKLHTPIADRDEHWL